MKPILSIIFSIVLSISLFAQSNSELYNRAMKLFNEKEYSQAEQLFSMILSLEDGDEDIRSTASFYEAESYYQLQDYDPALNKFEGFISSFPNSALMDIALYRVGTIYISDQNYFKARDRLFDMVDNFKTSEFYGSAFYLIGETYLGQNSYNEAIRNFEKALANPSTNSFEAHTIYSLGNSFENLGEYDRAVEQYDELLSFYRDSELAPLAQLRIGASYYNLSKYDNAVIELSDPRIKNLESSEESDALMLLANSFFKLGEFNNAKDIFKELIDKNPNLSDEDDIEFALAKINFQSGNYVDAYDSFVKLLTSPSDSIVVKSLYLAAESKRLSGEESKAQELYTRFLENYPNHYLSEQVALNLSSTFYQQGMTNRAKSYLNALINSTNKTIQVSSLTLLGQIEFNGGNYSESYKHFNRAVDVTGIELALTEPALLGKGISEYFLNDYEASSETLQLLANRSPNYEKNKQNFYLAEAKFALGEFQNALTYYNRVNIASDEIGKQTLYGKAYAYFNTKDYANAIYYFNEFISRATDRQKIIDAKLRLADSFYGTKNFERSSQIYSEVFSNQSSNLNNDYALYQFGQALFYADRSNEAIRRFRDLQEEYPSSRYLDESQYLIGWINFKNGNFEEAVTEYKNMMRRYPHSPIVPIALYSIGDSYFNLAKYDSSITYYNRLIDNHKNSPYVYDAVNGIQYAFIAKDQPQQAVAFLQRFVLLNPNSTYSDEVKFKQADVHYSLGEYEKARDTYIEFIKQYPSSKLVPNAHYWVGKCYELLELQMDAIDNFQIVVNKYIKSEVGVDAAIELANSYRGLNMNNKAIEVYDRVLDEIGNNSRTPEILFEKAELLMKMENMADAYETFDYIINYYNGTLFADKAKVELGILELQRGSYENAEILFSELGANRTDDIGAKAQYYYGVTLFEQEKLNQAISAFVRVRSVFGVYDEWFTKSLLKLGDAYVKLDDKQNARDMYRAVLAKHKNDEYGKEAQRKLNNL